MPIISFPLTDPGQAGVGLNLDLSASELPPKAWTRGQNVRFNATGIQPTRADRLLASSGVAFHDAAPAVDISTDTPLWCVGANVAVYALNGATLTDITRVSGVYTGATTNRWYAANLHNLLFLTNGVDKPQVWNPTAVGTKLIDLPNWQSTVRCTVLRAFKNFLIALDVLKGSTRYNSMVKWSHPADPGLVPPSWDETDTTKDAGEYALSETKGAVIDLVPLRDVAILYKEDSVWSMQYIGGSYIFKFTKLFDTFGLPRPNCAVEFLPGQHICFTGDDLILHNGQSAISLADNRVRSLFRSMSRTSLRFSFLTLHTAESEVWLCLALRTSVLNAVDTVLIYNWTSKTFSIRDLPVSCFAVTPGRLLSPTETWTTISSTWDTEGRTWADLGKSETINRLLGVVSGGLYQMDSGNTRTALTLCERVGIGIPVRANQPPDTTAMKFLKRVWPRVVGATGDVLSFTLGVQNFPDQGIVWKSPKSYTIGVTKKLDFTANGRLFGLRIESAGGGPWTLLGLDAEVEFSGEN